MVVALLYPTFLSLSLSLSLFVCCLFDWLKKGSIIKKSRRIRKRERERADTKDKQSLDIVSLCWFFTTQHSIAHFSSVKQKQNNWIRNAIWQAELHGHNKEGEGIVWLKWGSLQNHKHRVQITLNACSSVIAKDQNRFFGLSMKKRWKSHTHIKLHFERAHHSSLFCMQLSCTVVTLSGLCPYLWDLCVCVCVYKVCLKCIFFFFLLSFTFQGNH